MHTECRAAGSIGAATVQRRYQQQRRQINSILSSVGNVAQSFLSAQSLSIAIPTAIPSIPGVPAASTTPAAQASTTASSASNTTPASASNTLSIGPSSTASDASQSSNSPTSTTSSSSTKKSSGPSPGLIAGAVIGGVAVLLLLGILIMLILRHKRRKRNTPPPTYASPALEHGSVSARSLDETLVDRTPMAEHHTLAGGGLGYGNEKELYRASQPEVAMPVQSEMSTSANVWELDGRETERMERSELESPISPLNGEEGRRFDDWPLPSGNGVHGGAGMPAQRAEHSELHF
ncbi:hypothetical protein EK21DRAFT_111256 [Setomelanomma holmii]|uniref:Mid2 domain-containing protein n=1 Tax=Setomelanomma holmii TaxID=210430 RepID=A0A9P4HCR5_9PLEO|nr:hypothetical protein EK21DRAFT_111256 [Setomelanomma holmii]